MPIRTATVVLAYWATCFFDATLTTRLLDETPFLWPGVVLVLLFNVTWLYWGFCWLDKKLFPENWE